MPEYPEPMIKPTQGSLPSSKAGFLVSFLVDARGGAMTGHRWQITSPKVFYSALSHRHWGMRVVIPPGAVQQPTRVNCRYQPLTKMAFPPPFMEREALASRVVEISPAGQRFRAPVLIEIPHFASTANAERETVRDMCAVQATNTLPRSFSGATMERRGQSMSRTMSTLERSTRL